MAKIIKVPQLPWHGTKAFEVSLPDTWEIEVCHMSGYNRPAMTEEQIRASILQPIGTSRIKELARGKNEIVILFDDMARVTRVAQIVPFILEELTEAGIPDHKIRFIAATGTHGAMSRIDFAKKLGEEILKRFPVYNHNPFDHCTYVSTTSYGTKVFINAEVMNCDFKIAIGSITPHPLTVFSGGGKNILPGVASFETILTNHSLPLDELARRNYDTNIVRLDIEEGAKLVGVDVLVECIINLWGETAAMFVGALEPTHAAAVQEAKTHYLTPKAQDKEIVIANTFAKVRESAMGTRIAFPSVTQKGGDVVLIRNAPEGQIVHYLFGKFGRTIKSRFGPKVNIPPHINHLISYTEYPDMAGAGSVGDSAKVLLMDRWSDILDTLQKFHGENTTVAIYPNADIQYFG
jgi:nickel-dependent lactate racemase